jgi:hypothetical protein
MASTYISRTLASNGQKKGTISVWFKVAGLGTERAIVTSYYDATYHASILLSSNDQIDVFDYRSGYVSRLLTNRLFRDVGAWYHLVYEFDSTNGVADDRNKLWINGVQETSFSSRTNYGSSASTSWDTDYSFRIGARNSDQYWNGEMSHFYFIQGYNYPASTFGSTDATSGIWTITTGASVDYDGTGGNSCFLKMEDRTNLDLDSGDNSLTMTTTGDLTATYDNPSNNFAVLNSLINTNNTFSDGNVSLTATDSSWNSGCSTLCAGTGKWYAEMKWVATGGTNFGIADARDIHLFGYGEMGYQPTGALGDSVGWYGAASDVKKNGSAYYSADTYSAGDIISVALDCDNGAVYFRKNGGSWQDSGDPTSGASRTGAVEITAGETYFFGATTWTSGCNVDVNFGNGYFGTSVVSSAVADGNGKGAFEYAPPTGYLALCTANLGSDS